MEVSHNEISVVDVDIDRCRRHENARQTTDDEHRKKADRKQEGSGELNIPPPECGQPVEGLHTTGQRNEHGADHE